MIYLMLLNKFFFQPNLSLA